MVVAQPPSFRAACPELAAGTERRAAACLSLSKGLKGVEESPSAMGSAGRAQDSSTRADALRPTAVTLTQTRRIARIQLMARSMGDSSDILKTGH